MIIKNNNKARAEKARSKNAEKHTRNLNKIRKKGVKLKEKEQKKNNNRKPGVNTVGCT